MDFHDLFNVKMAREFCQREGVPLVLLGADRRPGAPDYGIADIGGILNDEHWDVVEVHSWASAAANGAVLDHRPPGPLLVFTPHTQPLSATFSDEHRHFLVEPTFIRVLEAADVICCLSQAEIDQLAGLSPTLLATELVKNGVDGETFRLWSGHRSGVLSVFDFREMRKRPDLHMGAFARAAQRNSALSFCLAGRGSDSYAIPEELQERTRRLGYVSLEALVSLYQQSACFVLLTDFEAFGLPIAEALCCGTPVVITDTPVIRSLFGHLPGVFLVDNRDEVAAAEAIIEAADARIDHRLLADAALAEFGFDATYGKKLKIILQALAAAGQRDDRRRGSPGSSR